MKNTRQNSVEKKKSSKKFFSGNFLFGAQGVSLIENELRKNNLQYLNAQKIKDLNKPPPQKSQIDERFTLYHIDDDMTTNMLQIPDFSALINGRAESLNRKGYLKMQISDSGCGINLFPVEHPIYEIILNCQLGHKIQ